MQSPWCDWRTLGQRWKSLGSHGRNCRRSWVSHPRGHRGGEKRCRGCRRPWRGGRGSGSRRRPQRWSRRWCSSRGRSRLHRPARRPSLGSPRQCARPPRESDVGRRGELLRKPTADLYGLGGRSCTSESAHTACNEGLPSGRRRDAGNLQLLKREEAPASKAAAPAVRRAIDLSSPSGRSSCCGRRGGGNEEQQQRGRQRQGLEAVPLHQWHPSGAVTVPELCQPTRHGIAHPERSGQAS
mmetsp:Transcript_82440/g.223838  ORF Transcript_82440/g.223838 Transcript_82440/m.223838 type:complete len:240 (-) Transcript_82440:5-724(-)